VSGPGVPYQLPADWFQCVTHAQFEIGAGLAIEVAAEGVPTLERLCRDRIHDLGDLDFELAR